MMKLALSLLVACLAAAKADNQFDNELSQRDLQLGLCRCEAAWENFYSRRLEEDAVSLERPDHRSLYHHYDYTDAAFENGYYIIEGVTVLPPSECGGRRMFAKEFEVDESHGGSLAADVNSAATELDQVPSGLRTPAQRDLTYYYASSKGTWRLARIARSLLSSLRLIRG